MILLLKQVKKSDVKRADSVTVSTLNEARIQNRCLLTPARVRYKQNQVTNLHPSPLLPPPLSSPVIQAVG